MIKHKLMIVLPQTSGVIPAITHSINNANFANILRGTGHYPIPWDDRIDIRQKVIIIKRKTMRPIKNQNIASCFIPGMHGAGTHSLVDYTVTYEDFEKI